MAQALQLGDEARAIARLALDYFDHFDRPENSMDMAFGTVRTSDGEESVRSHQIRECHGVVVNPVKLDLKRKRLGKRLATPDAADG